MSLQAKHVAGVSAGVMFGMAAVGWGLGLWGSPVYQAPAYVDSPDFSPNFLVLLADDLGQDMVGAYGAHPSTPPTPNLDVLASQGLVFDHAIANPVCSPTRGTLMTGRYSYRYGIGNAIPPRKGWGLPDDEVILPRVLGESEAEYSSAMVGKWHLATPDMGGLSHAVSAGFDHHYGTMGNLIGKVPSTGNTMTYFHWPKVEDGRVTVSNDYVTTVTIDDALHFSETLPEPWFIYVAFHATHFPMHVPPEGQFEQVLGKYPTESQLYRVMVEALDSEVGRLLRDMNPQIRDRTNILFLGDNGSAPVGVIPPWPKTQSKGALLRGGIRVPFVMAGPSVAAVGQRTDALVNTTDLFATVLELSGISAAVPEDSISFASVLQDPTRSPRTYAYAEHFAPNGMGPWTEQEVAIRDDRFKLVVKDGRAVSMFDLEQDPMEKRNLLRETPRPELVQHFKRLKAELPEAVKFTAAPATGPSKPSPRRGGVPKRR